MSNTFQICPKAAYDIIGTKIDSKEKMVKVVNTLFNQELLTMEDNFTFAYDSDETFYILESPNTELINRLSDANLKKFLSSIKK